MPKIKAFKGIYAEDIYKEHFATYSIENYTQADISKLITSSHISFLNIIRPTFEKAKLTINERFERVRKNYLTFLKDKKLIVDHSVSIYLYEQIHPNKNIYTGFLCLLDLEDFNDNIIKKHESTIEVKKQLFAHYLDTVHIQAEPTLITYTESHKLDLLMNYEKKNIPLIKLTDNKGIAHKVWKIDNRLKIQQFKEVIEKLDTLYIADGHHRMGSTSIYRDNKKSIQEDFTGNEPFNYILSYVIPSHSLSILEYNRLIKNLNGLTKDQFLQKLTTAFSVIHKKEVPYYPSKKFHISMYIEGEFYALYVKPEYRGIPEGLGELDTFLFQELLLKPILNIIDSRNDIRIEFERGTGDINGILALKEKVDSREYKVAFGFYPMNFADMKLIADLNLQMPPKSTYVEPKLLSGLIMYRMA